jgi:hypothetical protein
MVARWNIFKPKIPIWRALQWKMSVYFMAIRLIFPPYYGHLVYFPRFGLLYQKIWQPCTHRGRKKSEFHFIISSAASSKIFETRKYLGQGLLVKQLIAWCVFRAKIILLCCKNAPANAGVVAAN